MYNGLVKPVFNQRIRAILITFDQFKIFFKYTKDSIKVVIDRDHGSLIESSVDYNINFIIILTKISYRKHSMIKMVLIDGFSISLRNFSANDVVVNTTLYHASIISINYNYQL